MKFKDIVITIILSGILVYAVCHRCNIIPGRLSFKAGNNEAVFDTDRDSVNLHPTGNASDSVVQQSYPSTAFIQADAMR